MYFCDRITIHFVSCAFAVFFLSLFTLLHAGQRHTNKHSLAHTCKYILRFSLPLRVSCMNLEHIIIYHMNAMLVGKKKSEKRRRRTFIVCVRIYGGLMSVAIRYPVQSFCFNRTIFWARDSHYCFKRCFFLRWKAVGNKNTKNYMYLLSWRNDWSPNKISLRPACTGNDEFPIADMRFVSVMPSVGSESPSDSVDSCCFGRARCFCIPMA